MIFMKPHDKMGSIAKFFKAEKNGVSTSSSYSISPSSSSSSSSISSSGKISPAILFIIIIIAVIFFISGLLHLLVRFLNKHRSSLSSTNSDSRHNNSTGAFQRQLQQLFNLHDSGLDQSFIDSLPVFVYRDIAVASTEPFDCAVCLCEFSEQDRLRLLPLCTHAFHIECIDTWLLSNSTCPLCRGALYSPGSLLPVHENPVFYFGDPGEEAGFGDPLESQGSAGQKPSSETTVGGGGGGEIHKRVFSVRLGKLRNVNVEASLGEREKEREREEEESSGLSSRRCFSMGSYQYVVGDSDLQVVTLRPKKQANVVGGGGESISNNNNNGDNNMRILNLRGRGTNISINNNNNNNNNCGSSKNSSVSDGNCSEGKKIMNIGSKGESFSQSKIWQWPRKGKFPSSSQESHLSNSDFPLAGGLKFHEGT